MSKRINTQEKKNLQRNAEIKEGNGRWSQELYRIDLSIILNKSFKYFS